jgi:hypothetical protein
MQTDGNLVLYGPAPCGALFQPSMSPGIYDWWATNTGGQPGNYVVIQNDGTRAVGRRRSAVREHWHGVVGEVLATEMSVDKDWAILERILAGPDPSEPGKAAEAITGGQQVPEAHTLLRFVRRPFDSMTTALGCGSRPW